MSFGSFLLNTWNTLSPGCHRENGGWVAFMEGHVVVVVVVVMFFQPFTNSSTLQTLAISFFRRGSSCSFSLPFAKMLLVVHRGARLRGTLGATATVGF